MLDELGHRRVVSAQRRGVGRLVAEVGPPMLCAEAEQHARRCELAVGLCHRTTTLSAISC